MPSPTSAKAISATQRGSVNVDFDPLGRAVTRKSSVLAAAANLHAPAANTAAVLTFAASGSAAHILGGIALSYVGATPSSAGNVKVEDGSGTTVFSLDLPAAEARTISFNPPLRGSKNTAMIITLAAAGSSCTGKVNALGKTTEAA